MGTRVSPATESQSSPTAEKFGDLLYGRFSEIEISSVDVVRSLRERERE